jgi:hypothetical protein
LNKDSKHLVTEEISLSSLQGTTPRPTTELHRENGPHEDEVKSDKEGNSQDEVNRSGKVAFNPGWKFYWLFAVLSACALVAALDANIVAVALPVSASE